MSRQSVVLLREARPGDAFVETFERAEFEVECVPVLAFRFINQDRLLAALRTPDRYAGLILTSPRAAGAIGAVGPEVLDVKAWRGKANFVVGRGTGAVAAGLGIDAEGEGSGSAEAVLPEILRREVSRPYLFFAGNRRRDTLPEGLRSAGIPFHEIIIYETNLRTDFERESLEEAHWLVFFSPSGVEAVREAGFELKAHHRTAAIGQSTADALQSAGWTAAAVAPYPDAASLLRAIQNYDDPLYES